MMAPISLAWPKLSLTCPHCQAPAVVFSRHRPIDIGVCPHPICHGRTHYKAHYTGPCQTCGKLITAEFKI